MRKIVMKSVERRPVDPALAAKFNQKVTSSVMTTSSDERLRFVVLRGTDLSFPDLEDFGRDLKEVDPNVILVVVDDGCDLELYEEVLVEEVGKTSEADRVKKLKEHLISLREEVERLLSGVNNALDNV